LLAEETNTGKSAIWHRHQQVVKAKPNAERHRGNANDTDDQRTREAK
jgi:hypothetical protein